MSAPATATPAPAVLPWKSVGELQDKQGVNLACFGYPGSGKTTFGASGPKPLIIDVDGTAVRTLADRKDVQIAQPKSWAEIDRLSQYLRTRPHPFQTIVWDTVTSMYRLFLKQHMQVQSGAGGTARQPSQPEYGIANETVLSLINTWCSLARDTGIHVVFNIHAQEIKDDNSGIIHVRMALTPGMITGMNQATDTLGYIAVAPNSDRRQLLLRSSARIIAKHHQPMTAALRLPHEINDPTLKPFIDQAKAQLEGGKS